MAEKEHLLVAQLASAGAGAAFALAAIAAYFVSYGITIGFAVGAVLCFVAAHNFPALAHIRFRWSLSKQLTEQRSYWRVFALTSYISVGVAIVVSVIIGSGFYIYDLKNSSMKPVDSSAATPSLHTAHKS